MNMGTIYKITNNINDKIYIGQTIGAIQDRWYHHVYDALVKKIKTKLGRAIRKYGESSFTIEIIEVTDRLDEREVYFIQFFNSIRKGYNIKIGGNGGPHSSSTKKKIGNANAKRVWTEEMRENMSKAIKSWHEERGFVPRSEDFKRKISIANSNRKMPIKAMEKFQKYNESIMKSVVCITNGKEYPSIAAASKELNLNSSQLGQHLKGKHRHVKGLVFRYK
ncbi:MAG: GIY-YIG nuclease family protein [Leptolyngbyaceae cyanobacterium RM2_2_4]|nr:GIY-YIG nuclease family protein [Leptolyngbyaceae cyanobacterium RM2_2_4]